MQLNGDGLPQFGREALCDSEDSESVDENPVNTSQLSAPSNGNRSDNGPDKCAPMTSSNSGRTRAHSQNLSVQSNHAVSRMWSEQIKPMAAFDDSDEEEKFLIRQDCNGCMSLCKKLRFAKLRIEELEADSV